MSPVNVDLSNTTSEPISKGQIVGFSVEASEEKTSPKGNLYMKWVLVVTEPEEYSGRKLFHNTMLTKDGAWATANFLKTIGVSFGKDRPDLNGGFEPLEAIGKLGKALIGEEMYDDEPRHTIERIMKY